MDPCCVSIARDEKGVPKGWEEIPCDEYDKMFEDRNYVAANTKNFGKHERCPETLTEAILMNSGKPTQSGKIRFDFRKKILEKKFSKIL